MKYFSGMTKGEKLGAFCVHESNCVSNALALETIAILEGDEYIVSGSTIFITNAQEAQVYTVLVRTDPSKGSQGHLCFLLRRVLRILLLARKRKRWNLMEHPAENSFSKTTKFQRKSFSLNSTL
jgi:alkylation response protein AidB-like acyl-CoA dehydrogenase